MTVNWTNVSVFNNYSTKKLKYFYLNEKSTKFSWLFFKILFRTKCVPILTLCPIWSYPTFSSVLVQRSYFANSRFKLNGLVEKKMSRIFFSKLKKQEVEWRRHFFLLPTNRLQVEQTLRILPLNNNWNFKVALL
jgi:hypothetical protein